MTDASQRNSKRKGDVLSVENREAPNGIVESVRCINFMCHTHLSVDFGPLINFVVGENGSGKSAVLTALTLCLGAKASSTNRGGSLKNFIKEGQDHASIQVKLKNQGEGAFQPSIYGDSIVVERHFSRSGSSGFRLKSAAGRTISTKRRDVDELAEYFSLQMDNPLNILSQDNARQFLNASSAEQKYKFFLQGVQLEALDNDYRVVEGLADNMADRLEDLKRSVDRLERENRQAQRLAEHVRKNEALQAQRRLFRKQLVWAQVIEAEREVEKWAQYIAGFETRIRTTEQKTIETTERLKLQDEALKKANDIVQEMEEEIRPGIEGEVQSAAEARESANEEMMGFQLEERTAQARRNQAEGDLRRIQELIRAEEQRLSEATGDARARKEAEFEDAKAKVDRVERELAGAKDRAQELTEEVDSARHGLQTLQDDLRLKRNEIRAASERISQLQRRQAGSLDGYDRNLPQLLRLIDQTTGFSRKPLGPIGRHIQLLKPEWSGIVEKHLGGLPSSFIVFSKQDHDRLRNLMKRANSTAQIQISNGRPLDTAGKEPDPRFETILRILEFDDVAVRNILILHSSIEQILLIKDRRTAQNVMWDERPNNAKMALSFHDKRAGVGIQTSCSGRNAKSEFMKPFEGATRLKADGDSQLALQQELKGRLEEEAREMETGLRVASANLRKSESLLSDARAKVEGLKGDKRRADATADNLEQELVSFEDGDAQLTNLQEELRRTEESIEFETGQLTEMALQKGSVKAKLKECDKLLKAAQKKLVEYDVEIEQAKQRATAKGDARRMALQDKNLSFELLEREKQGKSDAEAQKAKLAIEAEARKEKAEEHGMERVELPDGATYESIEAKYLSLVKQLERIERQLGYSEAEIMSRAESAQREYLEAKQAYENLTQLQQDLNATLHIRFERWRTFQRYLSSRTRVAFTYLLAERAFRGQMLIDHRQRKLALRVEPNETVEQGRGRSTKTLSGGEKSYSSICMLLSIWEAMGSSIRCLDEFDVFMDSVNRAVSTNMLIEAARRSVSRQYILITPNAIQGQSQFDKDVKVIRLTDPRQRTLDQMTGQR